MLLNDLLNTYTGNKVKTERMEQNVWKSTAGPIHMERSIAGSVEWKLPF
jgi:hypothetical protein